MEKWQDYDFDIPTFVTILGKKYYYETWYNDIRFKSRNFKTPNGHDYRLFYICYETKEKFSVRGDGRQECIDKMKHYLSVNKIK